MAKKLRLLQKAFGKIAEVQTGGYLNANFVSLRQKSHTRARLPSYTRYWVIILMRALDDFLREQCRQRNLSLRGLSIKAGLSPSTVHNILTRKYQPSVFTLNKLADYLGVKREYLEAAFDEMESNYGTIEKYFSEGLGIDAAKQKALRDLYLGQE